MKRVTLLAAAIALAAIVPSLPQQSAAAAISKADSCGAWNAVCNRSCRSGGNARCANECASRHQQCLGSASGCYFFNNPGPRCWNNASDVQRILDFRNSRGRAGRRNR